MSEQPVEKKKWSAGRIVLAGVGNVALGVAAYWVTYLLLLQ
ncbi:hypothetical protein [Microbacterium schleiferi]|nr:hypothetical protein [Microbacterium schleiferi]